MCPHSMWRASRRRSPMANRPRAAATPEVEHMWLSEVDFDGHFVSGVLRNSPNWLKTVKEGDAARVRPAEISDRMMPLAAKYSGPIR